VLPLTFAEGAGWDTLGLKGDETVTIHGLREGLAPRKTFIASIAFPDGSTQTAKLLARIDTLDELEYFKNGGILPYVLRQLAP
jgi:aconitate hydratase